jgi:hypothetical protein
MLQQKVRQRPITQQLMLVSLFTAIYAVFRYFPTFPMIGLSGTSFRAGDFVAPVIAILLGPWLAVPCIFFGTVIDYAFAAPVFAGLDFLPATVGVIVAGLISRGRVGLAAAFYAVLLSLFVALPLSAFWIRTVWGLSVPYVWLHIVAFVILISPLGFKAPTWIRSSNGVALALGVGVTILAATMGQHVTGGILYELILFPVIHITTLSRATFFWSFIFYLYPIERLVITVIATTFVVAFIRAVRSSKLEGILGGTTSRPTSSRPTLEHRRLYRFTHLLLNHFREFVRSRSN